MIKIAATFLLVVGCLWALVVVWMLIGPFALIIGAVLLPRGISLRSGVILIGICCVILTIFALYNSIVGMHREPLQAPPPYLFYVTILLIMLLSDAAVYRVYRGLTGQGGPTLRFGAQR